MRIGAVSKDLGHIMKTLSGTYISNRPFNSHSLTVRLTISRLFSRSNANFSLSLTVTYGFLIAGLTFLLTGTMQALIYKHMKHHFEVLNT